VKGYLENYFQPCFGIQMSACIYKSERGIFWHRYKKLVKIYFYRLTLIVIPHMLLQESLVLMCITVHWNVQDAGNNFIMHCCSATISNGTCGHKFNTQNVANNIFTWYTYSYSWWLWIWI
jgi:hypothetical protein